MSASDGQRKYSRLGAAVWVLIYGGLLALCLSLFLSPQAASLRVAFQYGGGLAVAIGIVLIAIRARLIKSSSSKQ